MLVTRGHVLLVLCIALLPASALCAPKETTLTFSDERIYRVTITTSMDFEANSGISRVQVAHGLPVERPWSEGEHRSSARNVQFEPGKGKVEHDRKAGASFINWEERVPGKGGAMVFSTTYETTSVTRNISPEAAARAKWKSRRVRAERDMHPEVVAQAEALIKEPTPLEAMRKFSEWLKERIPYDASVPNTSVDDTMRNGAGHCGHRAAVLRQFTKALGLEARAIGGANLRRPDGGTDHPLFQIRPTWSNTHAWTEVEIPGVGWVEVEPVGKDKMFAVPAEHVQTMGTFQNMRVRVLQGGKWVNPEWKAVSENGSTRFVSDIGLRNVITYEVLGEPQQSAGEKQPDAPDASALAQEAATSSAPL